jgi:hypothetical protein
MRDSYVDAVAGCLDDEPAVAKSLGQGLQVGRSVFCPQGGRELG